MSIARDRFEKQRLLKTCRGFRRALLCSRVPLENPRHVLRKLVHNFSPCYPEENIGVYMKLFHTHRHLLGGTLLIAGTSIGVGMLGLPVVTAAGGFVPSIFVYLVCWFFMVCIARLILEAC